MTSIETEGDPQYWLSGKDVITPERKKAKNAIAVEGERGGRQYRSLISPLDLYIARRYVNEEQFNAGQRVHNLWRASILHARYARMNYGEIGSGYDPENMALAPRDYFRAMDSVRDHFDRKIVRSVCCFEEHTGGRKAMVALKSGLDDLVRHFQD
jgi:hypothetical protein